MFHPAAFGAEFDDGEGAALAFGFAGDGLGGPPVAEHADRVATGAEVLVEFGAWDDAVGGGAKRAKGEGEEREAGSRLWHGAAGEDLPGRQDGSLTIDPGAWRHGGHVK